jgi:hypothetical protein
MPAYAWLAQRYRWPVAIGSLLLFSSAPPCQNASFLRALFFVSPRPLPRPAMSRKRRLDTNDEKPGRWDPPPAS